MTKIINKTRGVFTAIVTETKKLCHRHYKMVVALDTFPPTKPGQFIQIQCCDEKASSTESIARVSNDKIPSLRQADLLDTEAILRRPFSLAGRKDIATSNKVELELIYSVVGTGTSWLAKLVTGDAVNILGPLGNGFDLRTVQHAILVGGGVGIPPMLYLAKALADKGIETQAIVGARTASLLPLTVSDDESAIVEFSELGVKSVIATDDGSLGAKGTAVEVLSTMLKSAENQTVFCCGPEPMMKAAGLLCNSLEIPCQVSMERHMGCGMGTCQSCVCKVKADNSDGWSYKLCCTNGPVFKADQLLWE